MKISPKRLFSIQLGIVESLVPSPRRQNTGQKMAERSENIFCTLPLPFPLRKRCIRRDWFCGCLGAVLKDRHLRIGGDQLLRIAAELHKIRISVPLEVKNPTVIGKARVIVPIGGSHQLRYQKLCRSSHPGEGFIQVGIVPGILAGPQVRAGIIRPGQGFKGDPVPP